MTNDQLMLDVSCLIFLGGTADYILDKLRLTQTELVETDGMTVFRIAIRLILAAVQNHSPYVARTEGVIGSSAIGRRVVSEIFGIDTARIMIAS